MAGDYSVLNTKILLISMRRLPIALNLPNPVFSRFFKSHFFFHHGNLNKKKD